MMSGDVGANERSVLKNERHIPLFVSHSLSSFILGSVQRQQDPELANCEVGLGSNSLVPRHERFFRGITIRRANNVTRVEGN